MWSVAKALQLPLDLKLNSLLDVPYTISFVIRKRQQLDNLYELPKEKRPPDQIIYEGTSEDLDEWLDRVFDKHEQMTTMVDISEVEG